MDTKNAIRTIAPAVDKTLTTKAASFIAINANKSVGATLFQGAIPAGAIMAAACLIGTAISHLFDD